MMQLYLVRHADSSFGANTDHQRPLSELGKYQATLSAAYLKQRVQSAHTQIICSDSLRTESTAIIIQNQIQGCDLCSDNAFYHARVGEWCDSICENRSAESLILVGHNPIMGFLAKHLNPSLSYQFSPSCVAHYELEILPDGLKLPAQLIDFFKPDAV